jgi:hypothetical protein
MSSVSLVAGLGNISTVPVDVLGWSGFITITSLGAVDGNN